jgi:hypothetical protein
VLVSASAATDLDLISYLRSIPDARMRRSVRLPASYLLLVAVLDILSGQGSLVRMERFAKRHRQTLNNLLSSDFGKSPSDSTFHFSSISLMYRDLKACCGTG